MESWINKLHEISASGKPALLATLIKLSGSTPRDIGTKIIVMADGSFFGTIGGGELEKFVLDKSKEILQKGQAEIVSFQLGEVGKEGCGGEAEILFEPVNVGPRVHIFGAGHVGQALCRVLNDTPFTVHLIDDREEWINSEKTPFSVIRHKQHFSKYLTEVSFDEKNSYIIIMTPNHKYDEDVVELAVQKPSRYIGLMGSLNKWNGLKESLIKKGTKRESLEKIHCPIGLPIGGKSPGEIAVSITAEMIREYYGKK